MIKKVAFKTIYSSRCTNLDVNAVLVFYCSYSKRSSPYYVFPSFQAIKYRVLLFSLKANAHLLIRVSLENGIQFNALNRVIDGVSRPAIRIDLAARFLILKSLAKLSLLELDQMVLPYMSTGFTTPLY